MRVGEVGGNTLGLYGGLFSPGGHYILAHDYQGAFHLWGKEKRTSSDELVNGGSPEVWSSLPTIGGHFDSVCGISWEPEEGRFLLSVSSDQTSRLHSTWLRNGTEVVCVCNA